MNSTSRYIAHASVPQSASRSRIQSAFKIEVRFGDGLSAAHRSAFKRAADRWTRVIVGDLPSVFIDGEEIDDLLIIADGRKIDGAAGVLGQSGPTVLRAKSKDAFSLLPAKGEMTFDLDDLKAMRADGSLADVIAHEMGHVLGIGTLWARKRLLRGATSADPTFVGKTARQEYASLLSEDKPKAVPVENLGDKGTRNSHWRESVFGDELMSGFIQQASNPLSRLTVASLADLGYTVDMEQAEPYKLPDILIGTRSKLLAQRRIIRPDIKVVG